MARLNLVLLGCGQLMFAMLAQAVPARSIFERTAPGNVSSPCYFPAGNVAYDNVPCGDAGVPGQCCASKAMCLANGLCRVTTSDQLGVTANSGYEYARGSCTDKNWGPQCFGYCIGTAPDPVNGFPGSPKSDGAAIFGCDKLASGEKQQGYQMALQNGGTFCCENGINAKDSCCTSSTFSLCATGVTSCGAGGKSTTTGSGSMTTTGSVTSTTGAPMVTSITSNINGQEYTLPCSLQNGITIIIFPENLKCHTGCQSGHSTYPTMGQVVNGSVISTSVSPFPYNPSSTTSAAGIPNAGSTTSTTTSTQAAGLANNNGPPADSIPSGVNGVPSATTTTAPYVPGATGNVPYANPSNTQPIMVPSSEATGNQAVLSALIGALAMLAAYFT